nr:hypothetical protein CFP56_09612 [Quercus suber]
MGSRALTPSDMFAALGRIKSTRLQGTDIHLSSLGISDLPRSFSSLPSSFYHNSAIVACDKLVGILINLPGPGCDSS